MTDFHTDRLATSEIEILDLREVGPDGGALMGFYARGHHDRWEFARACNVYTRADEAHDERYVPEYPQAEAVRHEWWRTVPLSGEPGTIQYVPAEPKSRGAFPVTVTTIVEDRQRRRTQRMIDEHRKGERNGFAAGLNWAIRTLDLIDAEAGNKLLAAYREKGRRHV